MVNRNTEQHAVIALEAKVHRLEQLFSRHTGATSGLSMSKLPHPNMSVNVTYTITNGTTDRTYDADASSTAELADVLYTLIQDLKLLGIIG